MLIFYIDEVGNGNLGPKSMVAHPWFVLGALGIGDVNRRSLAQALCDTKSAIFGTTWQTHPWEETEIKGRYLARTAARLSASKTPLHPNGYRTLTGTKLSELLSSLFRIYRTFSPVLYAIGIDKQRHNARTGAAYDPVAIAYAYLQQRLCGLADHTSHGEEGMLMLADEQRQHESLFRGGQIRSVRSSLQSAMHRTPDIGNIIAKPVWIDSDEMVVDREITQLVDFMLYAVSLGMIQGSWTHPWLENLGPHFARHWGRGKYIGAVWNAGITIYPRPYYRRIPWAQV